MTAQNPLLAGSGPSPRNDESGRATVRVEDPLLGKEFGRVRIQSLLGRGSMGVVYRGWHGSLDKAVAIKVLPERAAAVNPELIERFRREAVTAGRLEQAHVVQVYDVGEQEGYHYIVMQLVDGPSVEQKVRRAGPLPVEEVVRIARAVTSALDAAHRAGIVHRDVKPENILLGEEAKLGDFGLASVQDSSLTESGRAIGTPHYMAPEQCQGEAADARSDLYALGSALYYALTAKRPFSGSSPLSIMMQKSKGSPPPVATLRPDVPKALSDLVAALMAPNPSRRPKSASEVLKALDNLGPGASSSTPLMSPSGFEKHDDGKAMPQSDPHAEKVAGDADETPVSPLRGAGGPSRLARMAGVAAILLIAVGALWTVRQVNGGVRDGKPVPVGTDNPIAATNGDGPVVPVIAQAGPSVRSVCVVPRGRSDTMDSLKLGILLEDALRTKGYAVVARDAQAVDGLLLEIDLQKKDYVDPAKAITLGKQYNARVIVRPYVAADEILCSLVDTETGKVLPLTRLPRQPGQDARDIVEPLAADVAASLDTALAGP